MNFSQDNAYTSQKSNPYLYGAQAGSYLPDIIGYFHPAITGYKKNANSLSRLQAAAGVRGAQRNLEGYKEKSALDEQLLAQDMAGRGLGKSSIADENQAMFEHARDRAIGDLNDSLAIARQQQTVTNYAIRAQRVNGYLGLFKSFLGMGANIAGAAGAFD